VRVRDRVDALGGRLTITSGPEGAIRASGSLPRSR
jgi:signal transduction histidine kinase